jgi:trans-aconitate methyltransferase
MLQNPITFSSDAESHAHALTTLELLERYTDFMRSIDSVCDIGCGTGKDLEWWATRTILDDNDNAVPLNIKCTGIDMLPSLTVASHYHNISYEHRDFEDAPASKKYDVLWCHNAFQYAIDPLGTLRNFYNMLTPNGMLALVIPQTTNVVYHKQEFDQMDNQYYNYTLVSLMHMLAVSGFDCNAGFLKKNHEDPWIHAVVYKSEHTPMNPKTTRWFDLLEKGLLPKTAEISINKCGYVRQQDLVLPWLDKSNTSYVG